MADQYAGGRGRLNELTSIAAFTDLADVASFALTARYFASAIKNAEHILGPALAAKYAPAVLALHPMLADPKPSLFSFFKRHLRAKAASTAPQPARVPRSSLADYCFSYELFAEGGRTKVAWAGQAHFTESGGHQNLAVVEMPLRGTVVERIFEEAEDCRACMRDFKENPFLKDLQLTIYITKNSTAEVVKVYDDIVIDYVDGDFMTFEDFYFAPCLWHPSRRLDASGILHILTMVTIERDEPMLRLWISYGHDGMQTRTQADFLEELEHGFVFSRCL
jgi:hypothetical protein